MGEGAAPLARQQGHQRLRRPLEGSGLFEGVAPPIQVRLELIQHSHGNLWELSSESPRGVFVSGAERATRLNFENPPGLIGAGFGEGSETMDCDEVGFGWELMKLSTTIDDLIAAYGPRIQELPSNKPRDPGEREILRSLGDLNVVREIDGRTRVAGERRRPPKQGGNP